MKHEPCCEKFWLCGHQVSSRFFLAPINTGLVCQGIPTDEYVNFYSKRSGRRIGVTCVGNVAISSKHVTNGQTVFISHDKRVLDRLGEVSDVIKKNGSLPAIQVACRLSSYRPLVAWTNKNKEEYVKFSQREVRECPIDTIKDIIEEIACSAELLCKLGYAIVQIHSAHGYFLSRFLNRVINTRGDKYSFAELSFFTELSEKIRKRAPGVLIDFRLNLFDGIEPEAVEFEYKQHVFGRAVESGIDMISLSAGFYDLNKALIYPGPELPNGVYVGRAKQLASMHKKVIWNCAGNIMDIRGLCHVDTENLSFSMGRALIADPDFVSKTLSGSFDSVNQCNYCGTCHYFSRGKLSISCPFDQ